jgi:adenylate cyclase
MAEERLQRRLAAILSADVVGYSRLMGIDEAGTLARLKALRHDLFDPTVAAHAGRIVKLMGDGTLVEFASAVDAVSCAIEIQKQLREYDADGSADSRIQFRIGINVGDIIVDGDDIYGDGVNVAARIQGLAEPGGIYISRGAADQVRDKVPIKIETRGEQTVKNIARPIEVFCIVADEGAAITLAVGETATRVQVPAVADKPSIAVLAFNNMSGDAEQEYFSDGISEDIITDLSKLSELHVIARNSSFVYKRKAVSVPDVARDLGVRYVLEGSVRKAGNRVRVTAQLIDSTTGGHVWAERFDRDLTDIFAVQDELTQEIIAALKVKLTPEQKDRRARKSTIDVEAYNLFLRGREQTWLLTRSSNVEARNLLGRAIAINPDFAAAHAYVACTHLNDYIIGWADEPERSLQTGLEIAEQAVAMNEDDPQAHFAFAVTLLWNREHGRALAEAQRCLALAPNSAEGHLETANIQFYGGDAAGAVETIDAYMRLDPVYPEIALYFLAQAQAALGRFDEAVATLKRRLERNPNSETSYALLASCYGHLGRIAESQAAWAELMKIAPDFSMERRRHILPFKSPDIFEHRLEGMRKAGLPV